MAPIDWNPEPKKLRHFGWFGCVFFVALAAWRFAQHGWSAPALFLFGCAGLLGVVGTVHPERLRYVYVGMMVATFPIGWVMSNVILALIYYGIFTPVALTFRALGRDALQRRLEPAAATYWQPKRRAADMRQYLRQY